LLDDVKIFVVIDTQGPQVALDEINSEFPARHHYGTVESFAPPLAVIPFLSNVGTTYVPQEFLKSLPM